MFCSAQLSHEESLVMGMGFADNNIAVSAKLRGVGKTSRENSDIAKTFQNFFLWYETLKVQTELQFFQQWVLARNARS